ncbi:transmembrane protein 53 [Pseudonaja textilis]|uniref:Transmembrane protein 53 n=1 Tax=Pseudonaja textilis TaxID=8673 RepID=A0A670XRF9_PSETE|nr:transmembrane protein 53 [Pseudonaja textilis]
MERRARELGCVVDFPAERTSETSLEKGDKIHPSVVVVIMLGWAGCKDRYLEKYSAIYLQKGCLVIRYTAPWRLVFFSESLGIKSMQTLAIKLLKLLFDYKVETNPLLFHVFSNGGFMLYRYIVELLHTRQQFQHLRVVGTVFDSAPGRKNLRGAIRALSVVLASYNVCIKYFLLLSFAVLVVTLRIVLYPMTRFIHESHYEAMLNQPSKWPELYFYSKADSVILASDIEDMVQARRQNQVLVKTVDFVHSDHVSHLREYPTSYATHCISFMYSCIESTSH